MNLYKEEFAKIAPLLSKEAVQGKSNDRISIKTGAHLLGYIRRISQIQLDKLKTQGDLFYSKNDFIGITGIENVYEKELRGERGDANYLRDYAGNKVETIDKNPATPGKDIYTTIDASLQKLGEELMINKIGSIVAIEPNTGEILCMVSSPSYDPSILTGKKFVESYTKLKSNDSLKLINRPVYNDNYRPDLFLNWFKA